MTQAATPIAAILLAAGNSSRMGRAKQLLRLGDESLIQRSARAAIGSGCDPVLIVTGANSDAVSAELAGMPVEIIQHAGWAAGMGSSLRAGVAALLTRRPETPGAIILVCDQPHLNPAVLKSLMEIRRVSSKPMAACEYCGAVGPPCAFDRAMFPRLLEIPDDSGAKRVLMQDIAQVARLPWPQGAIDLDTPVDWEKFTLEQ